MSENNDEEVDGFKVKEETDDQLNTSAYVTKRSLSPKAYVVTPSKRLKLNSDGSIPSIQKIPIVLFLNFLILFYNFLIINF